MIENESQLERAYADVAKLVRQRDRALEEEAWDETLRRMVADGIEAQRRKIERQIASYLSRKLLELPEPAPAET